MLGVGGPCGDGTGGAVAADDRVAGPLAPLRPAAISAPTRVPMVAGVPEVPAGGPPAFDGFEVVLECFGMLVGERNSVPAVEEQARARSAVRDLLRRRLPNLVFPVVARLDRAAVACVCSVAVGYDVVIRV